jgi:hypothetical protein
LRFVVFWAGWFSGPHEIILNRKSYEMKVMNIGLKKVVACMAVLYLCGYENAMAAPEEIQVYMDEFADVGKTGLDLHTNYVASGQDPTNQQFRLTPELSYGINNNWETAVYWLTVTNPGELPSTDGMKIRAKYRPGVAFADSPFYWAVNVELGQLNQRFNPDESSSEIKLIGVWKTDPWTLGINFNVDRSLKSNPSIGTNTEADFKIAYQVREGLQFAVESYSYFGEIHNSTGLAQGTQSSYATSIFNLGQWDIDAGIGKVSGQTTDSTVIKVIIGVPL